MGRPIPKSDHKIDKHKAKEETKQYREKKVHDKPFRALAFHRDAFTRILGQSGCEAIRLYPGVSDSGESTLVLVGVDADGNDMVDGDLAQFPVTCPPFCSDPNELNSDG